MRSMVSGCFFNNNNKCQTKWRCVCKTCYLCTMCSGLVTSKIGHAALFVTLTYHNIFNIRYITTDMVLAYPDYSETFEGYTEASAKPSLVESCLMGKIMQWCQN